MIEHFELRLASSRMLAQGVRHYAFTRADGQPQAFIPGQFVQVHFSLADGVALKRSYSIATVSEGASAGLVEMAVSFVPGGAATTLFEGLAEGDLIEASGPYGRFVLHDDDDNLRYLLVATGTGVTPYRAMLPLIRRRIAERGQHFVLLFGARTPQELLYGEEFEAFATATPGFEFLPCFSRAGREQPRPYDRGGYVQDQLAGLNLDPAGDIAYLCGNPNMVDAAFGLLKEAGLPIPRIRREKYISPPAPRAPATPIAVPGA
jgi:ferredoxin-NADP reductase